MASGRQGTSSHGAVRDVRQPWRVIKCQARKRRELLVSVAKGRAGSLFCVDMAMRLLSTWSVTVVGTAEREQTWELPAQKCRDQATAKPAHTVDFAS